jgi:limonene-1,2-epoxide hydrolase
LVRVLRAALERDHRAIADLCTEDVKVWTPVLSVSSRDDLISALESGISAFSGAEAEVAPLEVAGPYACAEWTVSLTHTGTLEGNDGTAIEPTRARVTVHGVTVAEFRDERICALRQYSDEFRVLEQLSSIAAPVPP